MPWVASRSDEIVVRQVTTLALSFDHRHVDGEKGSRFLADVAAIMEDPAAALLFSSLAAAPPRPPVPRPLARATARCVRRPASPAARPGCRGRCRRRDGRRGLPRARPRGRGSSSRRTRAAAATAAAPPSPIHGSTSCSVRNSWPVHTTLRRGADTLGRCGDDLADRRHRPDAVEDTGLPGLDAADDPLGDVAGVDDLHAVVGSTPDRGPGRRIGQPLGPVRCSAPTGRRGRRSARAGSPSTARRRRARVARRRPSCRRTPPGPRPGRGPPRSPRPAGRRCRGPASRCRRRR